MSPVSAATAAPEGRVELPEAVVQQAFRHFKHGAEFPGSVSAMKEAILLAVRHHAVDLSALAPSTGAGAVAGAVDWSKPVEVVLDGDAWLDADLVERIEGGSAVVCYGAGAPGQRNRVMVFHADGSPQAPHIRNVPANRLYRLAAAPATPPREPDAPDGGGDLSTLVAETVERFRQVDQDWGMSLIRLVDGVHTYEAWAAGERREFDNTDDLYEWLGEVKRKGKERVLLATLRRATPRDGGTVADSVPYVVWSNEYVLWWRPNHRGYTSRLDRAGRYTRDEAMKIAATRDGMCWAGTLGDRNPPEIAIREDDALAMIANRARLATERGEG